MCVIIIVDKDEEFPKKKTLESAESLNKDGGGIAWLEDVPDPKNPQQTIKQVRWVKGINAKGIHAIIKSGIKPPAIIHFRIATAGGVKHELCHPFPITTKAEVAKAGMTTGSVLFHNGHWTDWKDVTLKTVTTLGIKIPIGSWSDSRAMTWLTALYGFGFLNFLPDGNKVALLTPKGIRKFGSGWVKVDKNTCSNDYFENRWQGTNYYHGQGAYQTRYMGDDGEDPYKTLVDKAEENEENEALKALTAEAYNEEYDAQQQTVKILQDKGKIPRDDYMPP